MNDDVLFQTIAHPVERGGPTAWGAPLALQVVIMIKIFRQNFFGDKNSFLPKPFTAWHFSCAILLKSLYYILEKNCPAQHLVRN